MLRYNREGQSGRRHTSHAQAMVACYFLAAGNKIQSSDGVFLALLHANGRLTALLSAIRVYHGLARVHEEKVRFPNRRFRSLGLVRVRRNTVVRKKDESRVSFASLLSS
jgi:hypothetical protein